jgi:LPXTG-motif cell wall-anchored protein
VTITGSIGSGGSQVVSSTAYNYQEEVSKELARTGVNGEGSVWLLGSGAFLLLLGAAAIYISRRKNSN